MSIIKTTLLIAGISLVSCFASRAQTKTINTKADFDAARVRIDSLDSQLIKIVGERQRIVREIGVYKSKNNIAPLQAARFKQVVDKAKELGKKEGLSPELVEEMMNAIHNESLKLEGDPAVKHNE